jgi:hypothetical protein
MFAFQRGNAMSLTLLDLPELVAIPSVKEGANAVTTSSLSDLTSSIVDATTLFLESKIGLVAKLPAKSACLIITLYSAPDGKPMQWGEKLLWLTLN